GICVSRMVRDQIRDRLPYPCEDMGEHSVKNIARPVRVFALRAEGLSALPRPGSPQKPARRRRIIVGVAATGVLIIIGIAWWSGPASTIFSHAGKPADQATVPATPIPTAPAAAISQPLIAPRLSIVVLPFANLSNDPDQQYFADGITEDLTT